MDAFRRSRAQALRRSQTVAEKALWRLLKRLPLEHTHFRRQAPIGPYVADFACLTGKVLIEVDGASHTTPEGIARDEERTRFLETGGYRVLRFWNNEIFDNPDGVLETIRLALPTLPMQGAPTEHPTPAARRRPSPSRGG